MIFVAIVPMNEYSRIIKSSMSAPVHGYTLFGRSKCEEKWYHNQCVCGSQNFFVFTIEVDCLLFIL